MKHKHVISVIVTYNRKECLMQNLYAMLAQTRKVDEIIIVDNASTDGTYEHIQTLLENNKELKYYRMDENTGGSGGFSWGIKKAYEHGADYIWGMDDDAIPMPDALEHLIKVSETQGEIAALWSNCDKSELQNIITEVTTWMFVGFFLPREIVKNVGFPRDDFFIYWDDHEYALRIQRFGYHIYKVRDSIIEHRDASRILYPEIKIGKVHMNMFKMPDWKVYYYVRNEILTYRWKDRHKYKVIFMEVPKILIKALVFKTGQGRIVLRAFKDGVLNKTGKVISP